MLTTTSPTFTFVKDGVFYFTRRIPNDLKHHYTAPRIAYSLRTRSPRIAEARARRAGDQLDEYWYHLRSKDTQLPGMHMLRMQKTTDADNRGPLPVPVSSSSVLLSEAVGIYLTQKGKGKSVTFHRAAERACGYVIDACGDKHLDAYTKKDANAFRDALIARGLAGTSMTRVFGTVRSVTNFAASEVGLQLNNPFTGVYYDRTAGVSDRNPVPADALAVVQSTCRRIDDDLRWLVALVSDTGMRLAEVAGMTKDDFVRTDDGLLLARICPHPWRRLKTKGSERDVPLEGAARWAAERILSQPTTSDFAFPRYNKIDTTNANSASAALNKWLKDYVPEGCTMHGFRHSMRDRLRAVECPADIVDQIGGWQTDGVGHGYGSGYPDSLCQLFPRDEMQVATFDTQQTMFVSERLFYQMVLGSTATKAIEFRNWVATSLLWRWYETTGDPHDIYNAERLRYAPTSAMGAIEAIVSEYLPISRQQQNSQSRVP